MMGETELIHIAPDSEVRKSEVINIDKNTVSIKPELTISQRQISTEWYYIIKYIAIITMATEHISYISNCSDATLLLCRMIGRIAFPLFAFELVECFHFTKNKRKHLITLGLLALISEFQFDIVLFKLNSLSELSAKVFQVQNVCFTFFLGFLMLCITNLNWNNILKKFGYKKLTKILSKSIILCTGGAFTAVAYLLRTDYAWRGIMLIFLFEFAKKRKHMKFWQAISIFYFIGCWGSMYPIYLTVLFTLIPIYFAESKCKGLILGKHIKNILTSSPSKMICRFFYPLHLAILAIVKLFII